jgi:AcrR family transcriptional regulator
MLDNEMVPVLPATQLASRREAVIARSVEPARVRSEVRVQKLIDAALDLMRDAPTRDFTVQDIAERSGQSARSFYQHFRSKRELVMAILEEFVRSTADHLRDHIAGEEDPVERLHQLVLEHHRLCQVSAHGSPAGVPAYMMSEIAKRTLTRYPEDAEVAFDALTSLFEQVLDEARAAAGIGTGMASRRIAGMIIQATMHHEFAHTIIDGPPLPPRDAAEMLWRMFRDGIGVPSP